jgi:hypothetical protein
MASNLLDSARSVASEAINRGESRVKDDARELSRRVQKAVRSYGDDYRYFTGQARSKAKKTPARNGRKTSGRSN